ncbi:MAG TPA: plastocyanin/azurin family copper-binding protein [Actinomycetota bacterium]|nr:plastocyanin/azurin family copper-binding protein [Actinomycetota bacterium]
MSRRLLVILALAAIGLAACSTKTAPPPSGTSTQTGATLAIQATAQLSFTPTSVTIHKGDIVKWNNSSGIAHNVTFDNGAAFSQALNDGTQISRTFTTTGTFNFHCAIHGPSMHGTIVVT